MKQFVRLIAVAALLLGFAVQAEPAAAQVSVKERTEQQEQISVKYPQFEGIDGDFAQRKINMDIKVKVDKFIDACKKDKYNKEAHVNYKIHYMDDAKVSFELESYTYSGGAHGMTLLEGYTYNLKTGQQCFLTQLFDFRPSEINQKIFAYAKENDVFLFSDFKGVKEYPDNFYLDEKGRPVILFQQYEIAPYSSGILKVVMN